ncbi:hypothetical protein RDWZM_008340 [Blomia tropicalis]|uniref:FYVE-type domain-containing protein n=1 Tax=Blomia tropicalis TaxID=40697 RepID=A0A9Q0M1W3_BLOTA|nr:hypothetical protein RDWZM_008340 [Blomia tropicalis]
MVLQLTTTMTTLDTFPNFSIYSLSNCIKKLLKQLELSSKTGNLILFYEILLKNLLKKGTDSSDIELIPILDNVIQLCDHNGETNHLSWLSYRIAKNMVETVIKNRKHLDQLKWISDKQYCQLCSVCSNQLLHSSLKCEDLSELYKNLPTIRSLEKNEHFQSILIKLKNSLFHTEISVFTSFVINILSKRYNYLNKNVDLKLNHFDKIYLQALIHALKNVNRHSMVDILIRCPDPVLQCDDNLQCQIIEYFLFKENKLELINLNTSLLDLYTSCLYRPSPLLIQSIYFLRLSNIKYRSKFFYSDSPFFFHLKECFLLAAHENKHFISQFRNVYCRKHVNVVDISRLPVKTQIIITLISLYDLINSNQNDTNQFVENISKFESTVSNLLLRYESEYLDKVELDDGIFSAIVEKLRFVLEFIDWCHKHINNGNVDRNTFCYNIIVSLLSGTSPLKILSNHGFLELNSNNLYQESLNYDSLCTLIAQFDNNESMILKGFVILRSIFLCILAKDDDNVYFEASNVKNLIQNITPIEFRIELLENIFCLLFLNKSDFNHHLNLNSSEDEDYLDETITMSKSNSNIHHNEESIKLARKRLFSETFAKTTCFLCPNWIIPKILEVLKDVLYKTSSDIYQMSHITTSDQSLENEEINDSHFKECKQRITTLIKYVGDAHFRYDVIRPAFYKNIQSVQTKEPLKDEFIDEGNVNRDLISTNSSDTDQKNHVQLNTSLENAVKIARLFQDDLKDSKELKELQLVEYFSELHSKICTIQSTYSDSSTLGRLLNEASTNNETVSSNRFKIGEIANLGIRSSKIQSLIYEMLLKMDKVDNLTKKMFMIDYALASSPSLEISQAILESVFVYNSKQLYQTNFSGNQMFPEKVELFLINFQRLITDLANDINTSNLSISDFLEKSLTLSSSSTLSSLFPLDAQTFINSLNLEIQLKKAYCEFYSHLNYVENRFIDEPDLLSPDNPNSDALFWKDSQLLLSLFDKINDHCATSKFHYLRTLLLYVRKVSKALVECKKRNQQISKEGTIDSSLIFSTSYFSILKQSPSAILCSMVIKSKISPKIIDDLALTMKVNLIAVLCSVYCPSITTCFLIDCNLQFDVNELVNPCLHELIEFYSKGIDQFDEIKTIRSAFVTNFFASQEVDESFGGNNSNVDNSFDNSFQPLINNEVLNYFNSKCSILVELLRILNLINDNQLENMTTQSMVNLNIYDMSPLRKWIERIKNDFYFGDTAATISLAFHPRIMYGHSAVIKTMEYYAANQNYMQIYNLFKFIDDSCLPMSTQTDSFHSSKPSFQLLQNAIYSRLVFMKENAKFAFHIVRDPKMKCELICRLLTSSDNYDETFMATRLIRLCLQSIHEDETKYGIDATESRRKLEKFLYEIEFYAAIGQLTGLKTWKLSKDNLEGIDILTIIKSKKRYPLAIDWYRIRGLEKETCDLHIELLIHAYSELNDYLSLRRLFHSLVDEMQSTDVIPIVEKTLNLVDNLELRTFLIDLLTNYHRKRMNFDSVEACEQYKLGIELIKLLSRKLRDDYLKLVSTPMLLVEQLLMNCEIDSLERIVNQYRLIKIDELIERYAQKSVYIEIYDSNASFNGSDLTMISSSLNDSSSASIMTNRSNQHVFVVPEKVPSRDQWVSNAEPRCMICHLVRFSMINRRHHCRRCGRVVCHSCSANTFLIPEINASSPVRVCNDCYGHLKINNRKASTHSMSSNNSFSNNNRRTNWFLCATDEVANEQKRFDFFYESAPSVTLCLAILRLHSNKKQCCKFIIDRICAPLLESTDSRNVDSTLLIEMIRSLLISTRISIEEGINHQISNQLNEQILEIEQLNLYLDRLDVIRMMINSNYGTKEMIGYVLSNNIQKLQEKLLEMERFELAVDIAKKYGLDSSSIWKTWATICLKHFQFVDARRKFSRYFDQSKRVSDIQLTLKNIVDILVRSNSASLKQTSSKEKCMQIMSGKYSFIQDHSTTSQPVATAPTTTTSSPTNCHLKPRIFQEIVYYFKEYGTPEDLLHFYVDHYYWKEAVDHFIVTIPNNDQHINSFLIDLFLPSQTKGSLSSLFTAIRQCDPQLNILWPSLIATCKYLAKNELYNSLYRLQIFMNDYLRAAITQINYFFLHQSSDVDYTDNLLESNSTELNLNSFDLLYGRIGFLEKARDSCNMYLHNMEYVTQTKPGSLHVTRKDVIKQIRLIETQIEVLKRFKLKRVSFPVTYPIEVNDQQLEPNQYVPLVGQVLRSMQMEQSIKIGKSMFAPTLLEHDIIRKSLITSLIILFFCDNLEEGFRYSLRLIQDHQLDSKLVYKMTMSLLLAYELEKNSTTTHILDLTGQLILFIRSRGEQDEKQQYQQIDQSDSNSSSFISPFLNRSISISSRISSTSPSMNNMNNSSPSDSIHRNRLCDEIVTSCIRTVKRVLDCQKSFPAESNSGMIRARLSELSESLIKLLSDDHLRIEAYLEVGKLKLAYLSAVSLGQRSDVIRVLERATQTNDQHYVKICEMWLRKNGASIV